MVKKLHLYYQKRAKEYELVYQKPERQSDLKQLHDYLKIALKDKSVFEIACGTGYWTQTIAKTCANIFATDITEEVLTIAKGKDYGRVEIRFEKLDFWQLANDGKKYDSVFGGFIWSHILKSDLPQFLKTLRNQLTPKGELIFIDNKYVEGSSTPLARKDSEGNTFQIRRLQNGTEYEVLKNFPTKEEVEEFAVDLGFEMKWMELDYFWILKIKKPLMD